jgi:O-antigen/teichoic acid export membrane protein
MKPEHRAGFFRSSFANVIRSGSALLVSIVLPPIVLKNIGPTEFNVWSLCLQLPVYLMVLEAGMLASGSALVAESAASSKPSEVAQIFREANRLMLAAAAIGLALSIAIVLLAPTLLSAIPRSLVGPARLCGLAVSGGAIAVLLAVPSGFVLLGLERGDLFAVATLVGRLLTVVFVAAVASEGAMQEMGLAYGSGIAIGSVLTVLAASAVLSRSNRNTAQQGLVRDPDPKGIRRRIVQSTAPMFVWSIGMLFVSGLDLAIVGAVDFRQTGAYSSGLAASAMLIGLFSAGLAPLLPRFAAVHARRDAGIRSLFELSHRLAITLLVGLGGVGLIAGPLAIDLWLPRNVATDALTIFRALIIAAVIRQSAGIYSFFLVATGQQKRILLSPIVEGAVNISLSVSLGLAFGAWGVAAGTVGGACAAAALHFWHNVPRTAGLEGISPADLLRPFFLPIAVVVPIIVIVNRVGDRQALVVSLAAAVAVAILAPVARAEFRKMRVFL